VTDRDRRHNPFVNSPTGGRLLSAMQLPFFLLRPPSAYGVLTTTGRKTGKRRRRCIRAVRSGDSVYIVAIKGPRTGWVRNVQSNPQVRLWIRGGTFTCTVREVDPVERAEAIEVYCRMASRFEYFEYAMWRRDRATPAKIEDLHRAWFERGTALVAEIE